MLLGAAALFSTGGAAIKGTSFAGFELAGLRSGVAVLAFLAFIPATRARPRPRELLVALAYAATLTAFVLANKLTTSANTIFLQSSAPLYVLLLGRWLLGERNRPSDFLVMAIVAAGLILFFVGSETPIRTAPDPMRGNVLAVAAGVTWALTIMGMRWLSREEREGRGSVAPAVVVGNLIALLVSLPFALPVVVARPLDWGIVEASTWNS